MEYWTTALDRMEGEQRGYRAARADCTDPQERARLTTIIDAIESEMDGIRLEVAGT